MEVDPSSAAETKTNSSTEKTRTFGTSQPKPRSANPYPPVCRFYSRGRYCQFGRRCRFLHEYLEPQVSPSVPENHDDGNTDDSSQCQGSTESPNKPAEDPGWLRPGPPKMLGPRERPKRPCRYYLSGYCAMEERCRFWHPEKQPPLRDCVGPEPAQASPRPVGPLIRPPVPRPAVVKDEVKLTELTQEVARQLRETEISQLMKRFPKDQLIIQESESGKQTYYRIVVEPTDPDWELVPKNKSGIERVEAVMFQLLQGPGKASTMCSILVTTCQKDQWAKPEAVDYETSNVTPLPSFLVGPSEL
eukprot:g37991.t1